MTRSALAARLRGLYGIVGDGAADPLALAEALCAAEVGVVQLRLKSAPDREIVAMGRRVAAVCRSAGALFVINDRADLAVLCEADGVHLGQDDLSPVAAREIVGPGRLVGVSTHSLAQARAAAGADYIGFGPIYATSSKADAEAPKGLGALAEVARAVNVPVVAIGGVTAECAAEVRAAGAAAAAVLSDLAGAADPAMRAREFLARWGV